MFDLHQLVSRQVQRWRHFDELPLDRFQVIDPKFGIPPVVTLSRQRGCRGAELACLIANELQYQVLDQRLIDYVAHYVLVRSEWVESLNEARRQELDMTLQKRFPEGEDPYHYSYALAETIQTAVFNGGVVILGRGANHYLAGYPGIRVRLAAPLDFRVQNLVELEGITEDAARLEIEQTDERRRQFVRQWYNTEIDDPAQYDLTINMEKTHLNTVVQLVVSALKMQNWSGRANRQEKRRRIIAL